MTAVFRSKQINSPTAFFRGLKYRHQYHPDSNNNKEASCFSDISRQTASCLNFDSHPFR